MAKIKRINVINNVADVPIMVSIDWEDGKSQHINAIADKPIRDINDVLMAITRLVNFRLDTP